MFGLLSGLQMLPKSRKVLDEKSVYGCCKRMNFQLATTLTYIQIDQITRGCCSWAKGEKGKGTVEYGSSKSGTR